MENLQIRGGNFMNMKITDPPMADSIDPPGGFTLIGDQPWVY